MSSRMPPSTPASVGMLSHYYLKIVTSEENAVNLLKEYNVVPEIGLTLRREAVTKRVDIFESRHVVESLSQQTSEAALPRYFLWRKCKKAFR